MPVAAAKLTVHSTVDLLIRISRESRDQKGRAGFAVVYRTREDHRQRRRIAFRLRTRRWKTRLSFPLARTSKEAAVRGAARGARGGASSYNLLFASTDFNGIGNLGIPLRAPCLAS